MNRGSLYPALLIHTTAGGPRSEVESVLIRVYIYIYPLHIYIPYIIFIISGPFRF